MTAGRLPALPPGACAVLAAGALFPDAGQPLSALTEALPARRAVLSRMDRLCGLALCAVDGALAGALDRWSGSAGASPEHTGIVFGSALGCHKTDEDYYRGVLRGEPSPRLFAYTLPSSPVGEISIHYGLTGPGLAVVSGGTAGLEALSEAQALFRSGQARSCLVAAAEVASPALGSTAVGDGAAALWVVAPGEPLDAYGPVLGAVTGVATAYAGRDPRAALATAITQALRAGGLDADQIGRVVCDARTRACLPDPLAQRAPEPEPERSAGGAVDALAGLARLAAEGVPRGLCACVTPGGLAAAVVWLGIGPDPQG